MTPNALETFTASMDRHRTTSPPVPITMTPGPMIEPNASTRPRFDGTDHEPAHQRPREAIDHQRDRIATGADHDATGPSDRTRRPRTDSASHRPNVAQVKRSSDDATTSPPELRHDAHGRDDRKEPDTPNAKRKPLLAETLKRW